ncbi:quinone oxidoreductase family protein [Aeromonas caviae]|uniref:quinone oxidoreductase family protein n=1 Tax=Aeromonas caviae TaxID=648 RepID=UPI002B48B1F1|nr:zinc-binding alcohol dehydrogenase family protein [Aeromonas caviae]
MKALVVNKIGDTPDMRVEIRDIPSLKPGYSLIKIHAATVNPLSNLVRLGLLPSVEAPLVLSNDGSGIIVKSDIYSVGQRVAIYGGGSLGITEDGLQQQYALVENRWIFSIDDSISLDDAAALPINYVSAYQAIHRVGQLQPGQIALISGATGSLGHALIQLTNAMGATPIAIVSSSAKISNALQSGAHAVVDLSSQDLDFEVQNFTAGQGADFAFDSVGGDVLGRMLNVLKTRGTLVSIGFVGGTSPTIDVVDLIVKEKRLLGFDAHLETDEDVEKVFDALKVLINKKKIKPRIDSVYELEQHQMAYQRLNSRQAQGTILLSLNENKE